MTKQSILSYINVVILFFIVTFATDSWAQKTSKQQFLFLETEILCNSKPDEALKIAKLILNNSTTASEITKCNLLISKIYKAKGDYNNVLNFLFEKNNNLEAVELPLKIENDIRKAEILRILYLDNQSKKYLENATTKIKQLKDVKQSNFFQISLILEKINMLVEREKYEEASNSLKKHEIEFAKVLQENGSLNKLYLINKGKIALNLSNFDKANYYFSQLEAVLNKEKNIDKYTEIYYLNEFAMLNFKEKKYQKAIDLLKKALEISIELNHRKLEEKIYKNLALNYLVINDGVNYKLCNTDLLKNNTEYENLEQESINTAHNLITREYDEFYNYYKTKFYTKFYLFLGILISITLIGLLIWAKLFSKKKRLNEMINFLEITRKNSLVEKEKNQEIYEPKEIHKKTIIPIETENSLLVKLKRFENSSRFTNKEMSLAVLAGQLDTNTKYLSEVINKHYSVNFNSYINKLRINYIIHKLKSDKNFINYKISYLAESCGFSSHSIFATIFKSITGLTPIIFIELLKQEKEENSSKKDNYETE